MSPLRYLPRKNENSKMTVLLGVQVPVGMQTRLDDAACHFAYERRDSVTPRGWSAKSLTAG
jgi:hypothetical protein